MAWHAVAQFADVRPGDVVAVTAAGIELIVARDGDACFALQRRCVHQGGDLADGILSRGHVICPQHGWRFAAATGKLDRASDVCLARYPTRIVDGRIEVEIL